MLDTPSTAAAQLNGKHPVSDPDGREGQMIQVAGLLDAAYQLHFDGAKNSTAGNALACTIDQARAEFARLRTILRDKAEPAAAHGGGSGASSRVSDMPDLPRYHRDAIDVECALTDLEGFAISLRIVLDGYQ